MRRMLPALLAIVLAAMLFDSAASQPAYQADVALDPGHSYVDVGAVGSGLREFELNLDTAARVKALLEARGYSVVLTHDGPAPLTGYRGVDPVENVQVEYQARLEKVGRVRCYVGINYNGINDPRLAGTETYYNADNFGEQSRRLAEAVQRNMLDRLNQAGYAALDRGVKSDLLAGKPYGHFFQLRGPQPSVTVEGLFLTNPADAEALWREDIRQAIAEGYSRGISEYLAGEPSAGGALPARSDGGPNSL
jgi:N-acetylmuramoyl-L-alanine amidase